MSSHAAARRVIAPGPPISNARLGTILFIATEVMLFAGLVAGYVVLRYGSNDFAGMTHPSLGMTAISTPVLLGSSIVLLFAQRGFKRGNAAMFRIGSVAALGLGCLFLALQMVEWNSLMGQGIFPAGSVQSGMFYLLSGLHGLHVFGGLVVLSILSVRAWRGTIQPDRPGIVILASLYWHFVSLLWLALFVMIFLT